MHKVELSKRNGDTGQKNERSELVRLLMTHGRS